MNSRRLVGLAVLLPAALSLLACDDLENRFSHRPPGEKLYRQLCADCHGIDARGNTPKGIGNPAADLTDNVWKTGGDPGSIELVIREGVFGEMPGHPELTNEQVRQLVDHLLKLRGESRGTS